MTSEQSQIFIPKLLEIATAEIGVKEVGNNAGSRVGEYQQCVHVPPGSSWCAAFVCWCIAQTEQATGITLTGLHRSAGVLDMWHNSPTLRTQVPKPGDIMIMQHGSTPLGHTGIVISATASTVDTIEGNTNSAGSRQGDGVYAKMRYLNTPKSDLHIIGFLDLTLCDVVTT